MTAQWKRAIAAGVALTMAAAVAEADEAQVAYLHDLAAFGIDRNDARLVLYTFEEDDQASFIPLGYLHHEGTTLTGIRGSTYVPGHSRMFYAFWSDDQGQAYLVHVVPAEAENDQLVTAMRPIEGGEVIGAASFTGHDAPTARTFILQRESVIPTYNIDGRININPNNAEHMRFEFQRVTDAGQIVVDIDRWHLNDRDWREEHGEVDNDGNLVVFDDEIGEGTTHDYEAHQTIIQVRPKGELAQDEIEIVSDTGQEFELHNANTYNLSGKLRVRIYNDHYNAEEGMAMGKWWLELQGQAQFEQSEVGTVNRIAELRANGHEVEVIEAAVLSSELLASHDIDPERLIGLGGRTSADDQIELFVAVDNEVYRIQVVESESGGFDADHPIMDNGVLTLAADRELVTLDFAGEYLAGVDGYSSGRFVVLDVDGEDTLLRITDKPGPDVLGAVTFLPFDTAEAMLRPNYD